jgi:hypothetical protein
MVQTFQSRIPALSDDDLLLYLMHFHDYRTEAVEMALVELGRRGLALPATDLARLRADLGQRHAAAQARLSHGFVAGLGRTTTARLARIRQITLGMLAAGLSAATAIFLLATSSGSHPLGFEPEDSKKFLREMEVIGGKINLLAAQITSAWNGLWQGRNLAFTVGTLTILLACAFWFLATRRARELEDIENEAAGH